MIRSRLSRRSLLKGMAALGALTPLAVACQQPPQVVEKVVTQVVEKQVTQVVEKPVERVVTQVVEKQVEKQVVVTATAAPKAAAAGEISWWAWGSEQTGFPAWRKQIDLFNKKFPGVKVNLQPSLGYDKIAVAIAAGTAADVIMINMPSGYAFIGHGSIINLQPYINGDKGWQDDVKTFHAGSIDAYTFRGDLYAMPQSLETTGTIYNEDMLKEAGLKSPAELGDQWTWDKFLEYAGKLTKGTGQEKVYGAFVSPDPQSGLGDLAYPLGARWVKDNGIETGVDAKEFVQAADFLIDFVKKGYAPQPSTLAAAQVNNYAMFVNLKIGLMLSGDWAFGWVLTRQLPDKKFKMDWAPSPRAPNGKFAAIGHYVAQGGYEKSKNKDAVLGFMREYATKASQEEITNNWENYPALAPRLDAGDYFWKKKLIPNEKGLRASFEANQPYPRTPVGDVSPIVVSPTNTALNAIMDGKETRKTEEVLKELAKKINDDMAKAAKGL
jgi:ABC-type glycerol-3-phosphate transport system substrate-binding protein